MMHLNTPSKHVKKKENYQIISANKTYSMFWCKKKKKSVWKYYWEIAVLSDVAFVDCWIVSVFCLLLKYPPHVPWCS